MEKRTKLILGCASCVVALALAVTAILLAGYFLAQFNRSGKVVTISDQPLSQLERMPLNPGPTDGSELITLRKPIRETAIYPGITLYSTLEESVRVLNDHGLKFVETTPCEICSVNYLVQGKLFGLPEDLEYRIVASKMMNKVDEIGVWLSVRSDVDEGEILGTWNAHIEQLLGPANKVYKAFSHLPDHEWSDGSATLHSKLELNNYNSHYTDIVIELDSMAPPAG